MQLTKCRSKKIVSTVHQKRRSRSRPPAAMCPVLSECPHLPGHRPWPAPSPQTSPPVHPSPAGLSSPPLSEDSTRKLGESFNDLHFKGLQYGCSQRGTEKIIHFTRQSLELHPDRNYFFMDALNAFNQISSLVRCATAGKARASSLSTATESI